MSLNLNHYRMLLKLRESVAVPKEAAMMRLNVREDVREVKDILTIYVRMNSLALLNTLTNGGKTIASCKVMTLT
jgi:hypothetical protein